MSSSSLVCALTLLLLSLGPGLQAQTQGKIKGTVKDETGAPLEYATVRAIHKGVVEGGAHVDSTGAFTIAPLPSGVYQVQAFFAGNRSPKVTIAVPEGATKLVDLVIEQSYGPWIMIRDRNHVENEGPPKPSDSTEKGYAREE